MSGDNEKEQNNVLYSKIENVVESIENAEREKNQKQETFWPWRELEWSQRLKCIR